MRPNETAACLAGRAEDVCRHLLPNGRRKGSEWCVGSLAGEPGDSLKVRLTGAKAGVWRDFAGAEDDRGDLIGLWQRVRGVDLPTACHEALAWLGIAEDGPRRRGATLRRPLHRTPVALRSPTPAPIPPTVAAQWAEGIDYLVRQLDLCEKIDAWRGWPIGTARVLLDDELLGCPLVDGSRTTAFAVVAPYRDELGLVSSNVVGFHARFRPRGDERPAWRYVPAGTGTLPFVIGGGCIESARHIVVLEGQWDAVAFAAHGRWLTHETAWPERVVVFGVRSASAWLPLVEHWLPLAARDARFLLVQDADKAGDGWRTTFVPALQASGFAVRLLRPRGAKDFSDLAKSAPLNPEELL